MSKIKTALNSCQYCGKANNNAKYCSLKCSRIATSLKFDAQKIIYYCLYCNKQIRVKKSRTRKFCNRECRYFFEHKELLESKPCECGCGQMAKSGNRFIHGHNDCKVIGAHNHNKPFSQECECGCTKITAAGRKFISGHNKSTLGFIPNNKTRQKMSASQRKRFKNEPIEIRSMQHKAGYHSGKIQPYERTEKIREKSSESATIGIIEGRRNKPNGYHTGWYYSAKNGKNIYYRSGLELCILQKLDNISCVASYQYEPFKIAYINIEGKNRNTVPDLLINLQNGVSLLVEIKPIYKVQKDINTQLKLKAMRQYAITNNLYFDCWNDKNIELNLNKWIITDSYNI